MTRQRLSTAEELQGFRQVEEGGLVDSGAGGENGWMPVTEPGARLNINSVLSGYISNAGTTCTRGRKSLGFTYRRNGRRTR